MITHAEELRQQAETLLRAEPLATPWDLAAWLEQAVNTNPTVFEHALTAHPSLCPACALYVSSQQLAIGYRSTLT